MKSAFLLIIPFFVQIILISVSSANQTRYCQYENVLDNLSKVYNLNKGQSIDRILVTKKYRKMYLFSQGKVYKSYDVAFGPMYQAGHKEFEGDYKTPEGLYQIDFKNPASSYYKALHVSYPNKHDISHAESFKKSPGGDVMIHGFPSSKLKEFVGLNIPAIHPNANWTQGCIAVTNTEIDEIYTLIKAPVVGQKKYKTKLPVPSLTLVEICPF
jgi:murein L,D-transpeptidase YafK